MQNPETIPELLAPAGNISCGLAAFEAGADAVYAGLDKFNARERSDNFTSGELSRLIGYARRNKRRVYVTLNTLIKEQELENLAEALKILTELGPDAVIVQDLGLVRLIREFFPDLVIHSSTQMGIHNSAGIAFAAKQGISRVILERQVGLDELGMMAADSPLELEVFIHGALCCSLSGNCLFSSWLGGWSGNRGKCKQPCRRRYFSDDGNGFFFSPKDLFSVDLIGEYKKLGIASLKIEGRLRKEDYVRNTVSAYRLLLDAPAGEEKSVKGRAKELLSLSPGRKWSAGFATAESRKDLIQPDRLGVQGLLIGRVTSREDNGFWGDFARPVRKGDRLRIQGMSGDEGPSFTVTRFRSGRKGKDGKESFFLYVDKEMPDKAQIYKTGSAGIDYRPKAEALPDYRRPVPVALDIRCTAKQLTVNWSCGDHIDSWRQPLELQQAENRALSEAELIEAFGATRDEGITVADAVAKIDGEYFLPASQLKKIRRAFWEETAPQIPSGYWHETADSAYEEFKKRHNPADKSGLETGKTTQGKTKAAAGEILLVPLSQRTHIDQELLLPFFCPETKLTELKEQTRQAKSEGYTRFRLTSPFQLDLFEGTEGLHLTTGFPFPVCNSLTAAELRQYDIEQVQAWVEMERGAVEALNRYTPLSVETYNRGRPHLLVTRAELPANGPVKDSRGHGFLIVKDQGTGLHLLLPEEPLDIPPLESCAIFQDLRGDNNEEGKPFNWDLEWK